MKEHILKKIELFLALINLFSSILAISGFFAEKYGIGIIGILVFIIAFCLWLTSSLKNKIKEMNSKMVKIHSLIHHIRFIRAKNYHSSCSAHNNNLFKNKLCAMCETSLEESIESCLVALHTFVAEWNEATDIQVNLWIFLKNNDMRFASAIDRIQNVTQDKIIEIIRQSFLSSTKIFIANNGIIGNKKDYKNLSAETIDKLEELIKNSQFPNIIACPLRCGINYNKLEIDGVLEISSPNNTLLENFSGKFGNEMLGIICDNFCDILYKYKHCKERNEI